ncbi:hypothetical protein HYPSUDRAFT_142342 [Hypholoma sublateritium FD-334 SS-4]|uniref:tRNA-guanine(15) transglycosylase-like domain-containing protein n=1 Tax=Hypholoma sublateritium (strain FD-334 SS-4) TaxID=945553 RepID=A0A0D2PK46_HYPSF|nr:hypothetical protein HYPSUDRAFT_142342 [Hypholoma sublateritium FD-334 SS-4]
MSQSSLSFALPSPVRYGPRLGTITLRRGADTASSIIIATPGLLASTSRGAVPHLSRDHVRITDALRWVNVPFETFLEQTPPIPILHAQHPSNASNPHPLHTFLGFDESRHLLSISAREPTDTREMPPNGNALVCVHSLRGVRKLAPAEWAAYARIAQPDVVLALSDTPCTDAPYSQKRLTKSVERSAAWLATLLRPGPIPMPLPIPKKLKAQPVAAAAPAQPAVALPPTPPVFVHLAGLTSLPARKAFAASLLEPLYGPHITALAPLKTLDEGVAGYTIDLAPLKAALSALPDTPSPSAAAVSPSEDPEAHIAALLRASLTALPPSKPRLVTGTTSPHEVLRLIATVGADVFDARWAQRAADVGVALDFAFPVRGERTPREIGHNLYDVRYRLDFGCFSDALPAPHTTATAPEAGTPTCPCAACAPRPPPARLYHGHDAPSVSGEPEKDPARVLPAYTRAYVHHLLHTHEMSAHALLAAHNLAVLDAFFAGVRGVLSASAAGVEGGPVEDAGLFAKEVRAFEEAYDPRMGVLVEAEAAWRAVDTARGKGRLSRETGAGEGEGVAPADAA